MLRDYQQAAVDASIDWMRKSVDPFLVDATTGSGKSHIIAEVARLIHERTGKRILCLAPSAELVTQNRAKYLATGNPCSMFSASAGAKELRHPVVFGSPLTVKNKISRFQRQGADGYALVVIDECFPAGTMIETPHGEKPIEVLRNGDIVCNAVGSGQVEAVFTKSVTEFYSVKLSSGTTIECTGCHPFFTERGWIEAKQLMEGEVAFCRKDVSSLLSYFYTQNGPANGKVKTKRPVGDVMDKARNLFAVLRKEMAEPHAQLFLSGQDARNTKDGWAQAAGDRGERSWTDSSAASTFEYFGGQLG
jgi:energy-coupling factor transporter ATP-binding protein EcfA2